MTTRQSEVRGEVEEVAVLEGAVAAEGDGGLAVGTAVRAVRAGGTFALRGGRWLLEDGACAGYFEEGGVAGVVDS